MNTRDGTMILFNEDCEDPFGNIIEIYTHSCEQTILSLKLNKAIHCDL